MAKRPTPTGFPKLIRLKGKKWYLNFVVAGRRFGECTEFHEPDFDKAYALAQQMRNDAILGVFNIKKAQRSGTGPTLAEVFALYWEEVGCHHKCQAHLLPDEDCRANYEGPDTFLRNRHAGSLAVCRQAAARSRQSL